jgi:hypothetical protein
MSTIKCKFCGKIVCKTYLSKHIDSHDISDIEKSKLYQSCLDDSTYTKMLHYIDFINLLFEAKIISTYKEFLKFVQKYAGKINSFVKLLEQYRQFESIDCKLYFDKYAPYKKDHPKDVLSHQLASCFCHDEKDAEYFYNKVLKPKNTYSGHDGRLSPWSKDFVGYKNLSDEDKNKARRQKCYCSDREDFDEIKVACNTTLEFYLNKGMNEDEAKIALRKRQTTFSLEKCIEKYGEVEGIKRFKERQEKWLKSLNTPENIEKLKNGRINGLKKQYGKHYSCISKNLFEAITNKLHDDNLGNFFATNKNGEYTVNISPLKTPMLDFYIPSLNKWIEFDGDYWHGEKRGNQERDKRRENEIFKVIPGIQLKRVKERDYRKNPEKIVNECVEWILNNEKI